MSAARNDYSGRVSFSKLQPIACALATQATIAAAWSDDYSVDVSGAVPTSLAVSNKADNYDKTYRIAWASALGNTYTHQLQECKTTCAIGDAHNDADWATLQNTTAKQLTSRKPPRRVIAIGCVRATAAARCSTWVGLLSVTVADFSAAPANLQGDTAHATNPTYAAGGGKHNSYSGLFHIKWDAVAGATRYELEEYTSSWADVSTTITGTTYAITPAKTIGVSYKYRARACVNATLCGGWSNEFTVTVAMLGAPQSLTSDEASNNSSDGVYTLSWSAVEGAAKYEWQAQGPERQRFWRIYDGHCAASTAQQSETVSGDYKYRVRACTSNDRCSVAGQRRQR